jgi:cysteine desulfurase
MTSIYFDNSATTRVDERVLEAMRPFYLEDFGNASSLHHFGRKAAEGVEVARKQIAAGIGAKDAEMIITSGGTEADNLAIIGLAYANKDGRKRIITSAIEHDAVLRSCDYLASIGYDVVKLPVDAEGVLHPETLAKHLNDDTLLVSIMLANNEIGTIQDVKGLAAMAHEKGALFHTDAVQGVCHMPIDVTNMGVDMLSMSAHKFHGPKGVGALYLKKGTRIKTLMHGGGQERGLRSSTENVPGIVGMGKAMQLGTAVLEDDMAHMRRIRDRLIEGTLSSIERSYLNGHRTQRLCNNAHFRFDYIEGESLILYLDMKGVAGSTGSACSSKSLDPSHVLMALGLEAEQAHGSLRLSLSRFSRMDEAEHYLSVIGEVVERLRLMSPTCPKKE